MKCEHDGRFTGVFGCKNGCLACELEKTQVQLGCTEAKVKELESRLSALQWRPIAEYDAMAVKPDNYVFCDADPDISDPLSLTRFPHDTHFLQLPPVPGENES